MAEQKTVPEFPATWQIGRDFDPNSHIMQLKGRDYMNVQARLLWFIRDQRALIVAGLAKTSYVLKTDLVEMDRENGYAHFMTYVRDVLGNEATMFGSETAKDFGDYAEKASTKSLGRALLALGYGTAFAPEMDEGERVVDAPQDRRASRGDTSVSGTGTGSASGNSSSGGGALTQADLKARAEVLGIAGPQWGAMWNRHKGDLAAINAELAQMARPRP